MTEETTENLPVVTKPKTFAELLATLTDADNAIIDLSFEDMEAVGSQLKEKVDSLEFILSKIESEKERLKSQIDRLSTAKSQIENKEKALKSYIKFAMESNGFEKLAGKNYSISFRSSESTIVKVEPDSSLFAKYPTLISRSYSWKKTELKKALKDASNSDLTRFAETVENKNIQFKVRKEV